MSRFKKSLRSISDDIDRLPLVHSTDCYTLARVVEDGEVRPTFCEHFREDLVYLFYGRPAYRVNSGGDPTSLRHHFPVCLIFDPNFEVEPKRVFPFDSGAFFAGAYSEHMHPGMSIDDFLIENGVAGCQSLVYTFFGANEAYFMGKALDTADIDPSQFEAQSYISLINNRSSNSVDSRSFCAEVQMGKSIKLHGQVLGIVIPAEFCDTVLGRSLAEMKIDLLPYSVHERSRPSEYMATIADTCKAYLLHKGLL